MISRTLLLDLRFDVVVALKSDESQKEDPARDLVLAVVVANVSKVHNVMKLHRDLVMAELGLSMLHCLRLIGLHDQDSKIVTGSEILEALCWVMWEVKTVLVRLRIDR
jgi:hypothetical protein